MYKIKLFDTLNENRFRITYSKKGGVNGEGAEFRLEGVIETEQERKSALYFIGKALKQPTLADNLDLFKPTRTPTYLSSATADEIFLDTLEFERQEKEMKES